MKSLKLKFQKTAVYNREDIHAIQILKQVCKQCEKQIPAFALEPVRKATEELDVIFRQRHKGLVMTKRENIIVIHADRIWTFGNRYTLESDPDGSRISVAVTGSGRLHDLFIDVCKSGNVLVSYKGRAKKTPGGKEGVVEMQLAIIPSNEIDSVYTYYYTSSKDHLKKASIDSLKKNGAQAQPSLALSGALCKGWRGQSPQNYGKGIQKGVWSQTAKYTRGNRQTP